MLLRRFMKHIKQQDWFAVGLDVIVVVVGIFLGLQVSEWNSNRHAASLERQYLLALDIDVRASKEHLEKRLDRIGKQTESLEVILHSAVDSIENLSDIEAASVIHYGLNSAAILPVQLRTYEDLKGSNSVSLLRNIELRRRLRELDSSILLVRQEESERLNILYRHVDPMLLKYPSYVELTRFWRNFDYEGATVRTLHGQYSAKEIFNDPKLINVAVLLTGITRTETRFLNDLMPLYDTLLDEIAENL